MRKTDKPAKASQEEREGQAMDMTAQEGETAPDDTQEAAEAKQEIIGPENESELLGCQDVDEVELADGLLTEYAVTAEGGLRLREDPSLKAPVLAVLPWGAGVFAVDPSIGEWIHVRTGLLDGWMLAEHLARFVPELKGVIDYA